MELRTYQTTLINDVNRAWQNGARTVLMQLHTGGGKTVIMNNLTQQNDIGYTVTMAHRNELVSQISLSLALSGIPHRIVGQDKQIRLISQLHAKRCNRIYIDQTAPHVVGSVDTMVRREFDFAPYVRRWTVDEGHHVLADNKWGAVVAKFTHPDCRGLLPTATPLRADGKGLGSHAHGLADVMVQGPPARWLIDQGYLTRYKVAAVDSHIDAVLGAVGASGDWSQSQIDDALGTEIVRGAATNYLKFAHGKIGVTFAHNVRRAVDIRDEFRRHGIGAEILVADTDPIERANIWDRLIARQIMQVVAVDVISEGVDIPAVEVGIMARPTNSLGLYRQQFGRFLRPAPNKSHALLIDLVGNFLRHRGGPDTHVEWTLDARESRGKRDNTEPVAIRICTNVDCFKAFERWRDRCPHCGAPVVREGRDIKEVDGELSLLDDETISKLFADMAQAVLSEGAYRDWLIRSKCPPAAINGNVALHQARIVALNTLRNVMGVWGGRMKSQGLSDAEMQRLFCARFGYNVLEAQSLNFKNATALTEKIRSELS